MNESRMINEPNVVGPGRVIYDNEPQKDMLVDDEQISSDYRYADGEVRAEDPQPVQDVRSRARTVVIQPMNYGYVVRLDCHEFALETHERVLEYVGQYLKDPSGIEEKWWKKELFK
jgi:hypothetical protein